MTTASEIPDQIPVTALDEAFVNLGETTVMSVQFEVQVSGTIDTDRLSAALRSAIERHPIARARMAKASLRDTTRTWEVADEPDRLSVEVVDGGAESARERLMSGLPTLRKSPAFAVTVVRGDDGDRLMFNFHHVAFDGMSAVRFVRSLAYAYAGQDDPAGGPPLTDARDLRAVAGAQSAADLVKRVGAVAGDVIGRREQLERVAHQTATPNARGYAFAPVHLDAAQVANVLQRKPSGCTVNDLLLAALALTVWHWNAVHDATSKRRISIMMPVNLRPADWSDEVVSNFASYLAVPVSPGSAPDLETATVAVRDRTKPLKDNRVAGWLIDVLEPGNRLPVVVKKNLQRFLPLVQNRFVDTTCLSNLGRLELPAFGDAGQVQQVLFSPPIFGSLMPVTVGAASLGREMYLCVRTKASALDRDASVQFGQMLASTLVDG